MSTSGDELVLGVPRARLAEGAWWRGVRTAGVDRFLAVMRGEGEYRPRREVEDDPGWKQVIPYVVVRDGVRLFLMRRTRAGGDARLFERYSVGVGGHVNPGDGGLDGGLRREWDEELEAPFDPAFRFVGLLNDDDDPVGAVHLGVVYVVDAGGRPVGIRETHKLSGAFATAGEVRAVEDRMESWSRLVVDHLLGPGAISP